MVVLTTSLFDRFVEQDAVRSALEADLDDTALRVAFQRANLPVEHLGDLLGIVGAWRMPLAVRSSSRLEDALNRPLAGVYDTKMLPNHGTSEAERFRQLMAAIRFVYASTFTRGARTYRRAAGLEGENERMAVIVQAVVGERHGPRFYPDVSIVARSYDYYSGPRGRPEEGIATLALGLGKTIVDGGVAWSYSPGRPSAPPPFGSVEEMLRGTQLRFWSVNLGPTPGYDPTTEVEFLADSDLAAAEYDGTLAATASTLVPGSGRLVPGTGVPGPRVLDFAPLLRLDRVPLDAAVRALLDAFERDAGAPVELELAMTLPPRDSTAPAHLALLQVRPMVVSGEEVTIAPDALARDDLVVGTRAAMGNGRFIGIRDVVFVDPDAFDVRHTRTIAAEIDRMNTALLDAGRPYVLVGFGRWGSADPYLGIPVGWPSVSGARLLVEATRPTLDTEPSQGTHFFHNLTSFRVGYLWVHHGREHGIRWDLLRSFPEIARTSFVRHVRSPHPLRIEIDGRSGVGAIWAADETRDGAPGAREHPSTGGEPA
jgi:hypothetical protein